MAAALGTGLPDTEKLELEALGYAEMQAKSDVYPSNSLFFVLPEAGEVSVGMVVNMGGMSCTSFSAFSLTKYPFERIEPLPEGIGTVVLPATKQGGAIYDLSGRRVTRPERGGVYIIGGQKVVLK